ncbi:MAG TPA: alpha/beta fold hydrolase [Ferruginibacter sp.]|nr:alpha/beta fold hydrolase [Ferruginibacter sp.]
MNQILLLHGAIGAKDQLSALSVLLTERYEVHAIDFYGHGGKPLPDEPFSIPMFSKQVLEFLDSRSIESIHIFGYSMGGYVGMYLAKHHPGRIRNLITLATKFYWDEPVAAKEIPQLNAGLIEQKLPAFAQQLLQRHHPQDWKTVLEKTKELLLNLGKNNALHLNDYSEIEARCLLLLGDRDKMVSLEETEAVYAHLPDSQLGILPGTPHPIEQVDMNLLSFMIHHFIESR